jgi:tetratricopeptide (TPR) repeat protein
VAAAWLALAGSPRVAPTQSATDSLTRSLHAAIDRYERGERETALREFRRFIDVYNAAGGRLTSAELVAVAIACTYLGVEDPQLFRDALTAYDRAIAADPANLDARVRLATLFLDKYNSADAKRTLNDVFTRDRSYVPALVLEARRRSFDNEPGADSLLERALQSDARNVRALVLRARFLADVEQFGSAVRVVDQALQADGDDSEALAFAAALRSITGDSSAAARLRDRYRARYPRDAGVHVALAELQSRVRQYASAAQSAREAVRIDSTSWRGYALLGANLLRTGDITGGRDALETAFRGDPFDVWTKNTLDLLDTFGGYDEIVTDRFRFMIEKAESAVLSLYLRELADSAYDVLAARYGFRPSGQVRVEVYRSHADFSVRTVGLAGLGALGVSFGNTVAFDSPAAREMGTFNWASTAWHELAHTFTLGASGQRVPRWFSEGLSVYEERRARPGWGQRVSPAFLRAYTDGRLLPASRLNDGFVRPAYPGQVLFSYYQASLVCELIARDWGERALMNMLQGYRSGQSTEQVVRRVLRVDMAELDRRFDAYMRQRFAAAIEAVTGERYTLAVARGRALLARGDAATAVRVLEAARALFPEYAGSDGPYPHLAAAYRTLGDTAKATEALSSMVAFGDVPYEVHVALADLLLLQGDTVRGALALEGAMYVHPYEISQHERLAGLYQRLGDHRRAVRERRAVVALGPVDLAEAWYQLALAHRDAGSPGDARHSVLRALEEAPHFERAQELLLALHGEASP